MHLTVRVDTPRLSLAPRVTETAPGMLLLLVLFSCLVDDITAKFLTSDSEKEKRVEAANTPPLPNAPSQRSAMPPPLQASPPQPLCFVPYYPVTMLHLSGANTGAAHTPMLSTAGNVPHVTPSRQKTGTQKAPAKRTPTANNNNNNNSKSSKISNLLGRPKEASQGAEKSRDNRSSNGLALDYCTLCDQFIGNPDCHVHYPKQAPQSEWSESLPPPLRSMPGPVCGFIGYCC
jgi:hypothetical protein